ncbi:Carboxylesterase [Xylariaceae sp. FL1019]|nr:Carboxylesterase [Xylariaceae sp. FL1019]
MLRTILGVGGLAGLAFGQDAPLVDLGYAEYQGAYNAQFDQNQFYGIRFAAPPARWQLPTTPVADRSQVFPATSYAPICPQVAAAPSSTGQPSGSEDCLFLNVEAPAGKTGLPVMVWIHGGGYGGGSAQMEWGNQIVTNGNSFVVVTVQYRLGAFGFLSSADLVANGGVPNVGLHDQRFALQWVKDHIEQFGGDPGKVTIYGESAGGGSVMLQAMAYGGTEGDALFSGAIPSSPYLPTQW